MDLKILKQKETPLMSRTRVSILAVYDGSTPSRIELAKKIASLLKVNENLVVIKHIYTRYGIRESKVIVHVYQSEKEKLMIEEKPLLERHAPKEKKGGPKKEDGEEEKKTEE